MHGKEEEEPINGSSPLLGDKKDVIITKNGNSLYPENHEVRFLEGSVASFVSSFRDFDEDDSNNKPRIPDGGWGWMIVFASLMLSVIMDGISFSFGLLYVEFLYEFEESKSATSWIGSLFLAVPLLTGPIMSALVDRYGCRLMTIVGAIISGIGFIASSLVSSMSALYVTFGLISGLGLGLTYVTAVVSIAYWFDKKRNLAIGLGACGTGFGTFIYAPFTEKLLYWFGWRGTVLILAGTLFNMCACGCLMRDPDWLIEENKLTKSSKKSSTSSTSVSGRSLADDFPDIEELRELLKTGKNTEYLLQSLATSLDGKECELKKALHRSDISLPTFVKQNEKVPLEVLQQLSANKKLYNVILENYPSLLFSRSTSDHRLNKLKDEELTKVPVTVSVKLKRADKTETEVKPQIKEVKQRKEVKSPTETKPQKEKKMVHQYSLPNNNKEHVIERKTSLDQPKLEATPKLTRTNSVSWLMKQLGMNTHNHFKNIKLHRNSVMHRTAMMNIHKYRLRASSCPDIYRNSMITLHPDREDKWYDEFLDLLKDMVDFSMFNELHFLLMSLSTILLFTWFIVPYFYLPDLMQLYGYSKTDISNMISVIGLTNAFGMVFLGWAGDQPWLSVSTTYGVCLVFCGISIIAMYMFIHMVYMMYLICALFGIFFASSFSFTPTLLAELVPMERFTIGYGLILLCQGIGNLIGPPIAGFFFDVTQSWSQSFLQSGIWIIISGVLILLIPMTKNRKIIGTGPLEMDASEKGSIA